MKKFPSSKLQAPSYERTGTTLIELLIVISMIGVISVVALLNLLGRSAQTDLNNATEQIASLLREARSRSVSQASSTSWGVHFENSTTTAPFYALFYSQTYSTSTVLGYYRLPSGIVYATSSIASGSSIDATFAQLSGQASSSASIKIYVSGKGTSNSSTISVASSGAVSF
ncbi:MAG: hypothetical protein A3B13_03265 [Candidatus Liptonbacteria bacterium RIFCSPLOWO2_01_FULL_45_15]|uniref:General secretion pathway GspH domain-containing protein n=1 Tax=Candidatus Liptonbacteria bacterium RIFCSPLOWO2_01_FULL_45_15 TaxID=1798649 RepID=A0A1G2CIR8_9BACT|nr:MAG: hypothetical protein A3B13_03265 [Candidatus Liptonbacteria bacterium RIFCSPLOWO2_01_FULL_45_15]